MPLSDAELQGIGAQALNMAKRDIERDAFNFLLASYCAADEIKLHRMVSVEAIMIERLGENWLNDWRRKKAGFAVLRGATDLMQPDALVFVTACNAFTPTDKFLALPPAQQEELRNKGHDYHHKAVKDGLLEIHDILLAVVQTPERVCLYQQETNGHGEMIGPPETKFLAQEDFDGNLKMYGTSSEEAAAS